ncbi:uncharacterized protein C17orf67 homolog isoform X2 [Pongo pygmaeus]|uniref:uncharacterized protein C17orf67 homolog isoform X2 n=1 Tax=Pongo pygmaeus TaxID=9600 RepID=UPI00300D8B54
MEGAGHCGWGRGLGEGGGVTVGRLRGWRVECQNCVIVENSGAPPVGQGHEHPPRSTAPRGARGPRSRPPLGADTSATGLSRTSSRCRRRRRRGCVRRLGSEWGGDLRGVARHGRGGLREEA